MVEGGHGGVGVGEPGRRTSLAAPFTGLGPPEGVRELGAEGFRDVRNVRMFCETGKNCDHAQAVLLI